MASGRETITGLKELTRTLEQIGKEIRDRDMNYATRAGAQHMQGLAKQFVPKDEHRIEQNIVVRKDKDTIFDSEYYVAIRRVGKADNPRNAFYAYFVEYGHDTRPADDDKKKRKHRAGAGVETIPAQPFMRPAWEQGRGHALRIFQDRISKRVRLRRHQIAKGKLRV